MNVFPIKAGAKAPPLVKDFPHAAKPLKEWGDVWGACNWGVHCAGMVVIDVDTRSGGDATFARLDILRGFPETWTTRTPSGGRHLYYALPEGHPGVPNSAGKLGPGIDIKSNGGYVLAAGSKVPAGDYVVETNMLIQPAPEWLILELGTTVPKTGTPAAEIPDAPAEMVDRALDWIKTRPVGDEAYKTACGLRDMGLSWEQALEVLAQHDGRPYAVLGPKVQHAYRYAKGEPGSRVTFPEEFPLMEDAPPPPPPPVHGALTFAELSSSDQPARGYLVKDVLLRGSHAVAYGPPGAGKTFVALDIAFHVASGKEWMGHRVRQGPVLYLAYEGMGGLAKRVRALRQHYQRDSLPLYFYAADFNLREQAGRKELGALLATLPETPALIVIDTLARAMRGGDENSAQDMGALNDAVGALIASTGACVLLLHHSGKNAANGARGSSALLGAIDTEINIDDRIIAATKQRDIEPFPQIGFRLHPVPVGMDEDGDIVVSCIVDQAAVSNAPRMAPAMREAIALIKEHGELNRADFRQLGCRDPANVGSKLVEAGLARRTREGKFALLSP